MGFLFNSNAENFANYVVSIWNISDTSGDFIRRSRRLAKSPGVPGAAIAIFADCRDRRIKLPIYGMSDIGD